MKEKELGLVQVRVLKACKDKQTKERYEFGDEIELDIDRANVAAAAALVEIIQTETPEI